MTTVITGRNLSLEIDTTTYDEQASSCELAIEERRETYEVLAGRRTKVLDESGTLTFEMYADWGSTPSLCEALWTAADTAPDTPLAFSFDANGSTWSGEVYPTKPAVGGTANDAVTVSIALQVAYDTAAPALTPAGV